MCKLLFVIKLEKAEKKADSVPANASKLRDLT